MENRGIVVAVCISEKRGTIKKEIAEGHLIKDYGIEHDAHAGSWHRQVSLLSWDKVEEFKKQGANVTFGSFGENILVKGLDLSKLPVGTQLKCNDVVLEITQIGKECHKECEIYKQVGDCIMPREGVFAKVLQEGVLCPGDEIWIERRVS
ncbi:MAG: MOSC domain-containing protein [Clostridiales bacterium]|nr:MOSC domain-containing protein [Clostridiales bacterium]